MEEGKVSRSRSSAYADSAEEGKPLLIKRTGSEDSEIIEVIQRKSGVFDTLVNLIKIGLGTGVLALPYAASVAGVVGAAICLVVAGAWNYFAVSVMIQCMKQREKKMGYSALANEAWGKYGLLAVDFALFITLMGAGVAYFVFIETTMIHVTSTIPQWCWVAMCIPLCTLLSFVNDLSAMAWVSAFAIVALVAGLISVWTYGASQTSFNLPADYLFRPEGLAQAFGISAFTFGHPIVFYPCYEQMRNADKLFMPTLLAAIVILVTGFIAMGTISVGFFWKAGVQQNIIANLASDSVFAGLVQTTMAIVTLLSYPLTMFIINRLVHGYVNMLITSERYRETVDYSTRALLVIVAGGLAVAFPYLADVVNLLGAFTLTSMCYIFPFAFAIPILKDSIPRYQRLLLWITMLMGTVAMIFCTYNAIYQMMHKGESSGGTPVKP